MFKNEWTASLNSSPHRRIENFEYVLKAYKSEY